MLLHKLKRMNLSKDYADFIQQLQWTTSQLAELLTGFIQ